MPGTIDLDSDMPLQGSTSHIPDKGTRGAVIVLGMHRSGTSAVCGALNLLGVDFGKRLLPATDANEKGFWEHEEIVGVHNRLLASLGSAWDDNERLPPEWAERQVTQNARSQLIGILQRDFADSRLFGIKDPRMCRLLPLWLSVFSALRLTPHFVLIVRHPWEVAESLTQRDGIEHATSYFLWLEHVVEAERGTRGQKRSFLTYEELMDDPVPRLDKLRHELVPNLRSPSEIQAALRQFLERRLRHHQFDKTRLNNLEQPLVRIALDSYEAIRTGSNSDEVAMKLQPLAREFTRDANLFRPGRLRTEKLSPENAAKISLQVTAPPREVPISSRFSLAATVMNGTDQPLFSAGPFPVNLAYHWIDRVTRQIVVFDGMRTRLHPRVNPNSTGRYQMKIVAPDHSGDYILQTTMVQEGVRWFEDIRRAIVQEFAVSAVADAEDDDGAATLATSESYSHSVAQEVLRPGVTIGIPIHRGQLFLEQSLASVQNQSYPEIEVILSLDGPDAECERICERFLGDARFRLVTQPRHLGWKNHTNWLMAQVETEFWHLQEQDDIIEPTFLETLVLYAREHPRVAAVYADARTFGANDAHYEMSPVIGSPLLRQLQLILDHFEAVAPWGLIRTEALRMADGLHANEFENFAADVALMAGFARWGELHRIPQELYLKRVHDQSTSVTWFHWEIERRLEAWQAHCVEMLRQALLIDATPQERRLLWLAVIERLLCPRTAGHFFPVAELSAAERTGMRNSFLMRVQASSVDVTGALAASWDEIARWAQAY